MGEHIIAYQPQIIRETAEGLNRLDIRDEMLCRRELELMAPVNAESCAAIIRALFYLQRQDSEAPVTLYINSPGGEVQSGLALYDVMRAVSCTIRTVCLGMAASMGALLFIAGDERELLPHSRVMIHDPLIGETSRPASSHATAACRSSASLSSRHRTPTSRRKKPWRRALRTASSRSSDVGITLHCLLLPARMHRAESE